MYSLRKFEMNRSTWSFYPARPAPPPSPADDADAAPARYDAAPARYDTRTLPLPTLHRSRSRRRAKWRIKQHDSIITV